MPPTLGPLVVQVDSSVTFIHWAGPGLSCMVQQPRPVSRAPRFSICAVADPMKFPRPPRFRTRICDLSPSGWRQPSRGKRRAISNNDGVGCGPRGGGGGRR